MLNDSESHLEPPDPVSMVPLESETTSSDVENTVEVETNPETAPDTEPRPERSALQKIGDSFRARAERFMTMLRGERLPEEDAEKERSVADKAKFGAKIGISVMATLGGYKGAWDAPAWFYQKFFTNPAERKRIKEELEKNVEAEEGEDKPSAIELKRAQIETAVQSSKFLSAEKKAELTEKLNEIMKERDGELEKLDETRNQTIAELLDEFITTRVKGTVALKEGVNTALHAAADATGLGLGMRMARSGTYGAVSLYERWNNVSKEREVDAEGNVKRTGSQMKEFMNGFRETKDKLLLKGEGNKFTDFAQASGTVARFVGMSFIGVEAGLQTDAGQDALNKMLDKFANIIPSAEAHELDHAAAVVPEETGGAAEVEAPAEFVGPMPEDAAEYPGPIEFEPQQLELGTVQSGDGILKVLERQMEASPENFGYEGDLEDAKAVDAWAKSATMDAARESGLLRDGGDTRLATESIDKLSIMAKPDGDGGIHIVFLDNETGDRMDLDQIREQGLTYEHTGGPVVAAAEPAAGGARPERDPAPVERPVSEPGEVVEVEDVREIPRSLVDGQLRFHTDSSGRLSFNTWPDPVWYAENQEMLEGMLNRDVFESHIPARIESTENISERLVGYKKILDVMEKRGLGDSPEADYFERRIAIELNAFDWDAQGFIQEDSLEELRELSKDVDLSRRADIFTTEADQINDIRIPGIGKIEFTYHHGAPSIDWESLSEDIGPGLRKKATELFVDGWQDNFPEARVDFLLEQKTQGLAHVWLSQEALARLVDSGHGTSPEADLLRLHLKGSLINYAEVLDVDNPVVRNAIRLTGVTIGDSVFDSTSLTELLELSYAELPETPEAPAAPEPAPIVEAAPLAGGGAPETPEVRGGLPAGLEKAAFGNTKFDLPGEGEVRFSYDSDGTVKNVFVPGKWVTDKSLMKEALGEEGLTIRGVTEQFAQEDAGIGGYDHGMPVDRDTAPLSGGGVSREARDRAREFIRKTTRLYVERQAADEMFNAGLSGTPEYAALKEDIEGIEKIMEKEYR